MSEDISSLLEPGEFVPDIQAPEHGSQEWTYGYGYAPIEGNTHKEGNSVVLDVEPGGAVEPVLITGDINLNVRAVQGKGFAVVYNVLKDDGVKVTEIDPTREAITLVPGDAYYYLNSGDENLILRDDSTPAFQDGDEVQLTAAPRQGQDGREIALPAAFWRGFELTQDRPEHVSQFFSALNARLVNVPELVPAMELAASNPEFTSKLFGEYIKVVKHLSELSPEDMNTVREAWAKLTATRDEVGSASKHNALDILSRLDDEGRSELAKEAPRSIDPDSPYFEAAVSDFVARTEGGHQLKLSGKAPVDGDPASDKVIWGHTQITNPEALLHFAISHYLERYFSQSLAAEGVEFAANHKDYFLNAMTDVLMLDHFGDNRFSDIYNMWAKPRNEGGLGWIKEDRIAVFALIVSERR